jgi:hypothetical protein
VDMTYHWECGMQLQYWIGLYLWDGMKNLFTMWYIQGDQIHSEKCGTG